jgi:GNAT superfamily N-acetyltransferase
MFPRERSAPTVSRVTVTLREITEDDAEAVRALRVAPGQERFVSSVAESLAEADRTPQGNPWFRAVHADGRPVGFVMLSWDVEPQPPDISGPWFLWKLLIDQDHQRKGYGTETLRQVVDLVRRHGGTELLTSYVPGEGGPAGFYARLGFVPTGDVDPEGEILLRLPLA